MIRIGSKKIQVVKINVWSDSPRNQRFIMLFVKLNGFNKCFL